MKRFILIVIFLGAFHEVNAQNKAIDTIWFRVPRVDIVDKELLNTIDSAVLVFSQEESKPIRKFVWYIRLLDDDSVRDCGNKVDITMDPWNFISPTMGKSDGFFFHNNSLFFISNKIETKENYDHIFKYTDKSKSFYYLRIDFELFWGSDLSESVKNDIFYKYAGITDYRSVYLTRKPNGLWIWHFSVI